MDRFHHKGQSSHSEDDFNPIRDKGDFFNTPSDDKIPFDSHDTGVRQNVSPQKRRFMEEIIGSDPIELHKGPEQHPHNTQDEFILLSQNRKREPEKNS